jgi:hypothetical protein
MAPKKVLIKMGVFTTDNAYSYNPNWDLYLTFTC